MNTGRGRCDHDPRRPRTRLQAAPAPRLPWIVKTAMKRAENFYVNADRFPEFTLLAEAKGGRVAKRRSQRREAVMLVAKCILRATDRRTWRVGMPRDNGLCNGLAIAEMVKQTGLSRQRVNRALRDLEEAGYIESSQPVEELKAPKRRSRDGKLQTHRGFPSVRWITPLFTRRLGIKDETRRKASEHGAAAWRRRRARPASPVALAGLRRARRELADPELLRQAQEARLARLARSQTAGQSTVPAARPSASFHERAEARLERLKPKPTT